MPNIGPLEIIIVLVIALVVFGPKRLPQLGRSIGKGINEFRDAIGGKGKDEDEDDEDRGPAELSASRENDDAHDQAEPVEGEVVVEKRD